MNHRKPSGVVKADDWETDQRTVRLRVIEEYDTDVHRTSGALMLFERG